MSDGSKGSWWSGWLCPHSRKKICRCASKVSGRAVHWGIGARSAAGAVPHQGWTAVGSTASGAPVAQMAHRSLTACRSRLTGCGSIGPSSRIARSKFSSSSDSLPCVLRTSLHGWPATRADRFRVYQRQCMCATLPHQASMLAEHRHHPHCDLNRDKHALVIWQCFWQCWLWWRCWFERSDKRFKVEVEVDGINCNRFRVVGQHGEMICVGVDDHGHRFGLVGGRRR